jgi:hypothetical protein
VISPYDPPVQDTWQLWGTFSVADHIRPRPFVSDVLVYDRLLIPTPDAPDEARGVEEGWQPNLQAQLIDILKDGNEERVSKCRGTRRIALYINKKRRISRIP